MTPFVDGRSAFPALAQHSIITGAGGTVVDRTDEDSQHLKEREENLVWGKMQ